MRVEEPEWLRLFHPTVLSIFIHETVRPVHAFIHRLEWLLSFGPLLLLLLAFVISGVCDCLPAVSVITAKPPFFPPSGHGCVISLFCRIDTPPTTTTTTTTITSAAANAHYDFFAKCTTISHIYAYLIRTIFCTITIIIIYGHWIHIHLYAHIRRPGAGVFHENA